MQHHDTIIVGAGPAGLQMGYFLDQAGRDYLILEATAGAGAFFTQQPRHRTLISLNKRFNYFPEPEFNMRHDWNSLLTEEYDFLFRDYSKELYPHADDIVRYLNDFAEKYALQIQFNTRVGNIARDEAGHFVLTDTQGQQYGCARLLMATGALEPRIPPVEGIELAEGYETHEIDPTRFENKRVLIMGRGNSAFEVANHLAGHAAIVHIAVDNRALKHAWQSHFVGDLRSINNTILDMVQLKALHFVVGFHVTKIARQEDGTLLVAVEEELPHWETPGTIRLNHVYDHVIRCTGWKYINPALFAPDTTPASDAKNKYPALNACWESSVPNLYYIGTAMAGRDRKAASGFIHGFRYNVRTLFHLLEERYEGIPYPSVSYPLETQADLETVAEEMLRRMSTTDALYQLYGVLGDALVFSEDQVTIYRDLPVAYMQQNRDLHADQHVITLTLEYGFERYPAQAVALDFISVADESADRACAAYLHPVFRHYWDGQLLEETHLGESLVIRYGNYRGTYGARLKGNVHKNIVMNVINSVTHITDEIFSEQVHRQDNFTPWTEEKVLPDRPVWRCVIQPNDRNGHNGQNGYKAMDALAAKPEMA